MKKILCDKCKEEQKQTPYAHIEVRFVNTPILIGNLQEEYDICVNCIDDFKEWLDDKNIKK